MFLLNFAVCALVALGFGDRLHWLCFLVAQARVELLWLNLLCVPALALLHRWKSLCCCIVVFVVNALAMQLNTFYVSDPQAAGNQKNIRLLEMNVEYVNPRFERARQFIRNTNPDVIVVEELTPTWFAALAPALVDYPYRQTVLRDDPYGNGIFSRVPFTKTKEYSFGPRNHPVLRGDIDCEGQTISIVHTHFQGPISPRYHKMHIDDAAGAEQVIDNCGRNVIFCGDLNSATWCYPLCEVVSKTQLRDTRRGRGLQLSWPTTNKFCVPLLAIDHCLVRGDLKVVKRTVGPSFGSDHFPVLLDFEVTKDQSISKLKK